MRDAATIVGIIRDRGRRPLPLEDSYRQLFNPALSLRASGRLSRHKGARTRGATTETVDARSLAKIDALSDALRHERSRGTPGRRPVIPQKSGKRRARGVPTWSDKLGQAVLGSIRAAY